jgi:hypothetical protein
LKTVLRLKVREMKKCSLALASGGVRYPGADLRKIGYS